MGGLRGQSLKGEEDNRCVNMASGAWWGEFIEKNEYREPRPCFRYSPHSHSRSPSMANTHASQTKEEQGKKRQQKMEETDKNGKERE